MPQLPRISAAPSFEALPLPVVLDILHPDHRHGARLPCDPGAADRY
ncbi:MAG: hypothetical protein ACLT2F_05585 [Butyricicoccus sp.]